jgi:predicted transposase/invertase (TIGR01784 family)
MKEILKDPVVKELNDKIIYTFTDPVEYQAWFDNTIKDLETQQRINDADKKGREEEKFRFVKNMLKDGVPLENISKYSGLSIEQIKEFKNSK